MENVEFLKAMLPEMSVKMEATQKKMDTNTKAMLERMHEIRDEIK
jgi:hypothetical protein